MPNVISVYVLNDQLLRFGGGGGAGGGVFCFFFCLWLLVFFLLPLEALFNYVFFILFDRTHIQCISGITLLLKLTFSCPLVTCTTAKQIE